MQFEKATKKQLLQIALYENCSIDYKYAAIRELQVRWDSGMITDLVRMYGKGKEAREIAEYLGISVQEVGRKVSQYRLRRVTA